MKSASQNARLSLSLPNPHRASLAQQNVVVAGGGTNTPSAWNDPAFVCYGVNVVGSGIADTSMNPQANPDLSALLAGTTSCAYRGVVSNGFTFAANGGDTFVDLQVPPGTNRVIQLVGITNAAYCASNFLEQDGVSTPGAYEIGRVRADLFGDATVSIPITYTAANSTSKRVDCGNGSAATILAAPNLSYSPASITLLTGSAATIAPANTGGVPTSCTITPNLPSGLSLDPVNCQITGTPAFAMAAVAYTVVGMNAYGSSTASVSIGINDAPPTFAYAGPYSFPVGYAVGLVDPTVTAGSIASCTIAPALPSGLSLDSKCRISGTPASPSAATTYAVTATGPTALTGTANVSIGVVAGPSLAFTPSTYDFGSVTVGTAAPPTHAFVLTNTGGVPASGCATATLTDAANFMVVGDTCTTSDLPVGANCTITVKANPGVTGGFNTVLQRSCAIGGTVATGAIAVAGANPVTAAALAIAGGATYTSPSVVVVNPSAVGATEMYLTNTAGCVSGGTWEPYSTSRSSWALGQMNATATVYVKYRNAALDESACVSDTIIHDNTAPSLSGVNVNLGVGAGQYGTNAQVLWTAGDANLGVNPVLIEASYDGGTTWSGIAMTSNTSLYAWTLPTMAAPNSRVRVSVTDAAGNVAGPMSSSTFSILGPPTQLVFDTPVNTPAQWHCVPYPMKLLDSAGQPTIPATQIDATFSFAYGTFYSNAGCTTPTSTASFPAGQGTSTIYLMPTAVGGGTMTVTATGGVSVSPPSLSVVQTLVWTSNTANPSNITNARYDHTLVSNGSVAMLWGGMDNALSTVQSTGARFDLVTNAWSPTATSPLTARSGHSAIWIPSVSKFLVWGGWNGISTYYTAGAFYDPAADVWTSIATFPTSGRAYSTLFYVSAQDAVYVYGGCTSPVACVTTLYKYSVAGNTWTSVSPTGTAPAGALAGMIQYVPGAGAQGRLVVWSGLATDNSTVSNGGSYYDVATNAWSTIAASPATAVQYPASAVAGTKVLLFGGMNSGGTYANASVYAFDVTANTWSTLSPTVASGVTAPTARSEALMAYEATSNRVFLWGGSDIGGVTTNGGVLDLNMMKWLSNMNQGGPVPIGRGMPAAVFNPNFGGQFLMWGGFASGLPTAFSVLGL